VAAGRSADADWLCRLDFESTGTEPGVDEIVSLAAVRLDANGVEAER
jgi:DNA polymerase III epsilon subunit-like protein